MTKTAMVFAAGLGARMRPLTDYTPKALLKVGGRTLLEITLERLMQTEVNHVIVNTHHMASKVSTFLQSRPWPFKLDVSFEPDLLETGGGLIHAVQKFSLEWDKKVLVLNTDTVYSGSLDFDLKTMDSLMTPKTAAVLATLPTSAFLPPRMRGDYAYGDKRCLIQSPLAADVIYTGIGIVRPNDLPTDTPKKFSLKVAFDAWEAAGRLTGHMLTDVKAYDCGSHEGFQLAQKQAQVW